MATSENKYVETPLMKQYYAVKNKYPDAVLLFRVGDFYETFGEDAIKASEICGITLTRRANGSASFVELAGFPYHALDTYLPKLVRAGQRVAICEQLEDPKLTKTIVKRGITELVTPGVSLNDQVLEHRENNFLASVHMEKTAAGVAFLDISTGEFITAQGSFEYVDKLLNSFQPKEVLFQKGKEKLFSELFGNRFYTYRLDDWVYSVDAAHDRLLRHFETVNLKGFGVQSLEMGILAAGAILCYLEITQHSQVSHITSLSRIEEDQYVWLDRFTLRNLELFQSIHEGARTLIDVLDRTLSPMGARLLKRWLALPLKDVQKISERQDVVEYFVSNPGVREEMGGHLHGIGDLERILAKVSAGRVNPREMVQLSHSLLSIGKSKELCERSGHAVLVRMGEQLNPCVSLCNRIGRELVPDPPVMLSKGFAIAQGVSEELDELRELAFSGKDYLRRLQERESQRTGISSLKVSYNNVFGYYMEVRNVHKDKVPP
ncbi:MAG: DNA mismatch repair protein MutS, partial [Marinilabiliales bacterium]|nr:DNA mismatch repair protein MutS [Marinilabiliales bacterium]